VSFVPCSTWALWHIGNKLAIERKIFSHPAEVTYKIQFWSTRFKAKKKERVSWMVQEPREFVHVHAFKKLKPWPGM
jgi:hypothetical protein